MEKYGYMTVSEVGRIAIGCSSFDLPLGFHQHQRSVRVGCHLRLSDPGYLGSEPFDMCFLLFQLRLGDEHWKGLVLDAHLLDLLVEPGLYAILPYRPGCWLSEVSIAAGVVLM